MTPTVSPATPRRRFQNRRADDRGAAEPARDAHATPSARRTLDLGAGPQRRAPEAIAMDRVRSVGPDVVADLAQSLPFRDASFSQVFCFDVVEHVDDVLSLLCEIHRVLEPGGTCLITTPHFSSANAYTDPTHRHRFGWHSFDYVTDGHSLAYYTPVRFRIVRRILRFHGGAVDAVARRIAARWPTFYERRLAWMLPAWYLEFELQTIACPPGTPVPTAP